MRTIKAIGSVLTTNGAPEVGLTKCPLGECEPVTLQVVLLGSDGIVIASDTCAENVNPRYRIRTTDQVSKIIIQPGLVYAFAGDECAPQIGAAVASRVGNPLELSNDLIYDVSNEALEEYKIHAGNEFREEGYRKIIWIQARDAAFAIWSATYDPRERKFVVRTSPVDCDGKCRVFAGDEFNQARYIVEHYYDQYPLRDVSGLKKMAAHLILTGKTFNGSVSGLEVVVGNGNDFKRVSGDEIQELAMLSRTIHEENSRHF